MAIGCKEHAHIILYTMYAHTESTRQINSKIDLYNESAKINNYLLFAYYMILTLCLICLWNCGIESRGTI